MALYVLVCVAPYVYLYICMYVPFNLFIHSLLTCICLFAQVLPRLTQQLAPGESNTYSGVKVQKATSSDKILPFMFIATECPRATHALLRNSFVSEQEVEGEAITPWIGGEHLQDTPTTRTHPPLRHTYHYDMHAPIHPNGSHPLGHAHRIGPFC